MVNFRKRVVVEPQFPKLIIQLRDLRYVTLSAELVSMSDVPLV